MSAGLAWDEIRHGLYAGYASDGCRCPDCRRAKADYVRERRRRGLEPDPRASHGRTSVARPAKADAEHHRRALQHLKFVHKPPQRSCATCRELFAEGSLR